MSTQDLISAIADANYSAAEDAFDAIMANKVSDAIDAKRIEVAKNLFNTAPADGEIDQDSVEDMVPETDEVETQEVEEIPAEEEETE
jgi:hypothetical protein